jgi:hypothetical protein
MGKAAMLFLEVVIILLEVVEVGLVPHLPPEPAVLVVAEREQRQLERLGQQIQAEAAVVVGLQDPRSTVAQQAVQASSSSK